MRPGPKSAKPSHRILDPTKYSKISNAGQLDMYLYSRKLENDIFLQKHPCLVLLGYRLDNKRKTNKLSSLAPECHFSPGRGLVS